MNCFQRFSYVTATILLAASVSIVAFPAVGGEQCIRAEDDTCVPNAARHQLGHGINYLQNSRPISGEILNLKRATVHVDGKSMYGEKEIKATSSSEYNHELALSAGLEMSYGAFEADASAKSNKSSSHSTSANYSSYKKNYEASRYYLNRNNLHKITTWKFKQSVKEIGRSLTPQQFWTNYGTHVSISSLVGAQFELRSDSTNNDTMSQDCFEAHVHAKYNSVVASGDVKADYKTCSESNKSDTSLSQYLNTTGGDSSLGINVNSRYDDILAWQKSTANKNFQTHLGCGYGYGKGKGGGGSGMQQQDACYVWIWELIADRDKALAVKNAFYKYLALHPIIKIFSHSETANPKMTYPIESTVSLPNQGADWRLLSGGTQYVPQAETSENYNGSRPMLLKDSYPVNHWQWKSRMTRANGNYPTGTPPTVGGNKAQYSSCGMLVGVSRAVCQAKKANPSEAGIKAATVTTHALALYDPLGLWKTKHTFHKGKNDDRTNVTTNKRYGVLANIVPVADGYTLVGGGAKVNLPANKTLSQMPANMKGPYLTSSFPDPKKSNWVSQFTNMVTVNYGCDPASPYHWGCNDGYNGRYSGGPPKRLIDTIKNNTLSWTELCDNNKIPWHCTHYDSTMTTYAIGIRLQDQYQHLGVATIQEVIANKNTNSTEPHARSSAPVCIVNQDNIVHMTGGGALASFNITPFFITSSYPYNGSQWDGFSSNDINYVTKSSLWHDVNTKYHKRHWEYPSSDHSPSWGGPNIAGTLYSFTNAVIFTDNPKKYKHQCESNDTSGSKKSKGGVIYSEPDD